MTSLNFLEIRKKFKETMDLSFKFKEV